MAASDRGRGVGSSGYRAVVSFGDRTGCGNQAGHSFRVERFRNGSIAPFKSKRCGQGTAGKICFLGRRASAGCV